MKIGQSFRAHVLLGTRFKHFGQQANYLLTFVISVIDAHGGTPELHNLALDYKAAAEKRYQQNLEATVCQKTPLPEGLLSPLTSFA